MKDQYGLLGIGNAMVDLIASVDNEFLTKHSMDKGAMTLVDQNKAESLYADMDAPTKMSGGSASNTMACFGSFGGQGAFIGKVADDDLGQEFRAALADENIHFSSTSIQDDTPTARCMIFVTPDAERTMNTYLGAAGFIPPDDIDEDLVKNATVSYLEGYLFDRDGAKQAFYKTSELVKKHNKKMAITLSDSFCVERFKDEFLDLVKNHADIVFSNEAEILSLYNTLDIDIAIKKFQIDTEIGIITQSERGSLIVTPNQVIDIDAVIPPQVLDTTGAGDAYAGGFLYGYTQGLDLEECGRLASVAASEVISHMGPRPSQSLRKLANLD